MFSSEGLLANHSASPDCEMDWLIPEVISPWCILALLTAIAPSGWFGRTSPVLCQRMMDGTFQPSSGAWSDSGMASPTECLTLSTVDHATSLAPSRSDDGVSCLSDILETGDVPPKYFLTPRACAGILRRAAKRGKELPRQLQAALQQVADSAPTSTATAD